MANQGKTVGLAFLIIITALFSALVMPELFDNLVNQENASNENMLHAIRIIIVVGVIFIIGGIMKMFIGGEKSV